MKKSIRNILVVLLALTAVIFAVAGLTACSGGAKLESLTIENAKTVFFIGDEFEYGANFTVYANYSDGTKTDVTDSVEIKKENGFDMNVEGDYQLTVIYENKREVYTIYVNDFENPLRKLELDTSKVKTQFELGESISLDGLVITSTYENAQGQLIVSTSTDLRNLKVEITNENGDVFDADGVFTTLGEYTIKVSSGSVSDSYTVSVSGINISTVEGAIAVGGYFKSEVVSGTQKIRTAVINEFTNWVPGFSDAFDYEYEYGKNFTRIAEHIESNSVQYLSLDSEGLFCVTVAGDEIKPNSTVTADMINGAPLSLWYYAVREYGIESALANLYENAKTCTNKDLKETADEQNRKYSFSFSGLIFRSNDANYFETEVSFSLGENYNIENVKIEQKYWENNSATEYDPTFVTDKVTGITTTDKDFSHMLEVTVTQTAGERTAENPYNRNMFRVQSYNLVYNGRVLGENDTLNCSMENPKLTLSIEEVLPKEANFAQDTMYFKLEGGIMGEVDGTTMLFESGFMAWLTGNDILINFYYGGTYKLIIRTTNTYKTITFDVVGEPPVSLSAQIYNETAGLFAVSSSKVVALNGSVYFYAAVNAHANPAQTATVISDNAANAKIESVQVDGVDCFKFTANAEGEYTVVIRSSVANITCNFTFTVSDIPDFAELLKGSYTVQDLQENIFSLEFAPADGTSGTLNVTKTPTETDGTPITAEAKSATYSYSVDMDNLTIDLVLSSGTELGVGLTVDVSGRLVLVDQYGDRYVLTA